MLNTNIHHKNDLIVDARVSLIIRSDFIDRVVISYQFSKGTFWERMAKGLVLCQEVQSILSDTATSKN